MIKINYIIDFIDKYKRVVPENREEEFQMATIQAIEGLYNKLKEIEKLIKNI